MKASDIMKSHDLWACKETTNAREVAQMMAEHNVGAIPVQDPKGKLEGIVTDRDLVIRLMAKGLTPETPVREIMSSPLCTVHPDADLTEVEKAMREHRIRRLPVVDDENRFKGFISIDDLFHYVRTPAEEHELVETLDCICTSA